MTWLVVLGFAVSSSVDNFGVGLSYGLRNIKLGLGANGIIALICFLFSMISTILGNWLSIVLPGALPIIIGAVLLLFIGLRIVLLTMPQTRKTNTELDITNNKLDNILRHPELADADKSGEISISEAVLLGAALSANALTNGLGAGLLECSALTLSLITAIGSFISLWAGALAGKKAANIRIAAFNLGEFSTLISGVILILIAIKTILL